MATIEVRTQQELDDALASAKALDVIAIRGSAHFEIGSASVWAYDSASVWASGSASVRAYDSASVWASGSASVWAYDSASVRAYDSASVWASGSASVWASGSASVWASGSASVWASGSASVRAYDSASVWASGSASVRASGSASVWASGSASVRATNKYVAVHLHASDRRNVKITGGVLIEVPEVKTPQDWIDYHDIAIEGGHVIVFKAVDDDWSTDNARAVDLAYRPGTELVAAPDWRKMAACGNGLHASAKPIDALLYNSDSTRFVALRAKVAEIVVIDESKIKVPRLYGPIVEVDINGEPLPVAEAVA
jgi:hypothetical protein